MSFKANLFLLLLVCACTSKAAKPGISTDCTKELRLYSVDRINYDRLVQLSKLFESSLYWGLASPEDLKLWKKRALPLLPSDSTLYSNETELLDYFKKSNQEAPNDPTIQMLQNRSDQRDVDLQKTSAEVILYPKALEEDLRILRALSNEFAKSTTLASFHLKDSRNLRINLLRWSVLKLQSMTDLSIVGRHEQLYRMILWELSRIHTQEDFRNYVIAAANIFETIGGPLFSPLVIYLAILDSPVLPDWVQRYQLKNKKQKSDDIKVRLAAFLNHVLPAQTLSKIFERSISASIKKTIKSGNISSEQALFPLFHTELLRPPVKSELFSHLFERLLSDTQSSVP